MSYNGYNGYSPYYNQQRAPDPDGRNQNPYQTSSAQNSYQSQYPNANGHQHHSGVSEPSNYSPSVYNEPSRYSRAGSSSNTAYQTDHSYNGARSSEDTTGLGSLAYASSLRQGDSASGPQQGNESLQRVADYNKSASYADEQRSDSKESERYANQISASSLRVENPYHGYGTAQQTHNPQSIPSTSQYPNFHLHKPSYKSSSRPSSDQNTHATQSRMNAASDQSPALSSTYQLPAAQRSQASAQQSSQQSFNQPSWGHHNEMSRREAIESQISGSQISEIRRSQSQNKSQLRSSNGNQTISHTNSNALVQLAPVNNFAISQSQKDDPSLNTISQNPITIDPNKVFNEYEYQRRQAAIAAEAKAAKDKAASEADAQKREQDEARRKQTQQPSAIQVSQEKDQSVKQQMETEMKLMLEKMRDYKSKDPTLFSQIWEQVKKAQPPSSTNALPASKDVNVPSPRIGTAKISQKATHGMIDSCPPLSEGYLRSDNVIPSISGPPEGYVDAGKTMRGPVQKVWMSGKSDSQASLSKARQEISTLNPTVTATTSQSMATSLSASAPRLTGQTHWPEGDKWALALAARDTLLSHPSNKGREIFSADIRNLLDQGPSYEELCDILEKKGFVVERTLFARQLLSAVPHLKAQQPERIQNPETIPKSASSYSTQSRLTAAHGTRTQAVPMPVAHMNDTFKNASGQSRAQAPKGASQPDQQIKNSMHQESNALFKAQPVQPVNTKEQKAKKRSFADIIDLSADINSDEELYHQQIKKMQKFEVLKSQQATTAKKSDSSAGNLRQSSLSSSLSAALSDDDPMGIGQFVNDRSPRREHLRKTHVIQSLIRDHASRRSTYNPRTIAQDILIAAGKHSVMPPLNCHLDSLRTKFRYVDHSSDLSTFNWALIDPGGPAPRKDTVSENVERQNRDHKNVDCANVEIRKGASAERRSSLIPPWPSFGSSESPGQQPPIETSRNIEDVFMLGAGQSSTIPSRRGATPSKAFTGDNSILSGERKRRGRPPKAKNNGLGKPRRSLPGLPQVTPDTPGMSIPNRPHLNTAPSRPSNPGAQRASPPTPNNAQRVLTTPARPSGLRNEVTISPAAGFAVVIPSPSHAAQSSRGSEASPSQVRNTDSPAPMPNHQMYRCRWRKCPAELHNLDTLKRHVRKHKDEFEDEESDYQCLWQDCGNSRVGAVADLDREREPLRFKSETSWERHMNGRHLDHYAWNLGDGPSLHASDAEASDYLSDSQHRKVTPEPSASSRRSDTLIIPPAHRVPREAGERQSAIEAYHDAHGITSRKQKAQADFDAQLQKRRKIGSGIVKGGTEFVNDEMRQLLSHGDYEIRRVEDDSD